MSCVNILHELETTLIVRTDWKRVSTGKHHSAFDASRPPSVHVSSSFCFSRFSANSLTFAEFLAREQIFLITSRGDTSALQGKGSTVEARGEPQRAAALLRCPVPRQVV